MHAPLLQLQPTLHTIITEAGFVEIGKIQTQSARKVIYIEDTEDTQRLGWRPDRLE